MNNEKKLDEQYWNRQYLEGKTPWDMGLSSRPLEGYSNQMTNKDLRILIPGGGNSYEAEFLLLSDIKDITIVDISSVVVEALKEKFRTNKTVKVIHADFFDHQGTYDLIFEQTFFCAIDPSLRRKYVSKIKELLVPKGKLVGLLFDRAFDGGPPFGGSKEEYLKLFGTDFELNTFERCYNSVKPRENTELFINITRP